MPAAPPSTRRVLAEALGAFALATAIAAALYRARALDEYFHALVAALFLYVPAWLIWRRGGELEHYGLRLAPLPRHLALVALAVLAIFPLFLGGFLAWHKLACAEAFLRRLAPGPCLGIHELALRLPPQPLRFFGAELIVVALPEEFFFRGYLMGRLAEIWPARRRLLGAPAGAALVASAALFALCHVAVQGNAVPAAVFFPGLVFGWLRARSGSVVPGTLFHALCNLYIEVLHRSFFG